MKAPATVSEYLDSVPEPARSTLNQVRAAIRAAAPKQTTETISYGMPMFEYKGMLMGVAAFKQHCSLFPGALLKEFENDLQKYTTTKGSIHFPLDKPLPAALVKKLVKAKLAINETKSLKKKRS
jgi:uncharacterized protein YdhG (YjbR/CyaY superfamily)